MVYINDTLERGECLKKFWLVKTEPDVFSFEDLLNAPKRTTSWEGVRNYQARNFMRDEFKLGDSVFIYHSNTDEPAVMGIAEVVKEGYVDSTALDPKHKYFDEDSFKKGVSPWVMVDVKAVSRFETPVTRTMLKENSKLSKMLLLQKGSRLSVQPVSETHFDLVCKMGRPKKI